MSLRAVLFDVDGTLVGADGAPVPGVEEVIVELRKRDVRIAAASNQATALTRAKLSQAGLEVDLIVGPDNCGARKPSPVFCTFVASEFGIETKELLYVGDSDETDALVATNARVLYVGALWSNPNLRYGLPVASPESLLRFIYRFLLTEPVWFWTLNQADSLGRQVDVRVLLRATRDSHELKNVLKFGQDPLHGKLGLRGFYFRRLLTTLYLDGTASGVDFWTWYPTASGQAKPDKFNHFLDQASKVFRGRYLPDLLIRHSPAIKSAFVRGRGESPKFVSQTNTMRVNEEYRKTIQGKHVLVVDDFCTAGLSFECARNLLYLAGAAKVALVAFGRYHDEYEIKTLKPGKEWNPFAEVTLAESDFKTESVFGANDHSAASENTRLLEMSFPPEDQR